MKQKISKWISLFFDLEETMVLKSIYHIKNEDDKIIVFLKLPRNQKIEIIFSNKNKKSYMIKNHKNYPVIIIYLTTDQKELLKEKHFENTDIYILNTKKCLQLKNKKELIKSPKIINLIELSNLLKKEEEARKK